MKRAYVSLLSTDSYLPGILALHRSLTRTGTPHEFILLITPDVSAAARARLAQHGIECRLLDEHTLGAAMADAGGTRKLLRLQLSAHDPAVRAAQPVRWTLCWVKLHIFSMAEFEKLVYLDADMLVNRNIDELFERPHMSAVNAGGLLPERASWQQLNAGLLVIEPSAELFAAMMRCLESSDEAIRNDQLFLQHYYPDWPARPELHLDHSYNMFDICIDRYHELFGYGVEDVHVFHYIGAKPWDETGVLARWKRRAATRARRLLRRDVAVTTGPLREAAYRLWVQCYGEVAAAATNGRA